MTIELNSKKNNINFEKNEDDILTNNLKRPNIYFFVLDAMMPLNEFKDYYKKNLSNFEKFYNKKNYKYYKDTQNLYVDTTNVLTSLFFLDEIFIEAGNYTNDNCNDGDFGATAIVERSVRLPPVVMRMPNT